MSSYLQCDGKLAAFAYLRFAGDLPSQLLRDGLEVGEAQANASGVLEALYLSGLEHLEELANLFTRDASAGVHDGELDFDFVLASLTATLCDLFHEELDMASGCKFQRILQKSEEHALQFFWVSPDLLRDGLVNVQVHV